MRVAGHSIRPSWASLLTIGLAGLGTVNAVDIDIEDAGESYLPNFSAYQANWC
jgi:hypothetical protein